MDEYRTVTLEDYLVGEIRNNCGFLVGNEKTPDELKLSDVYFGGRDGSVEVKVN